jgi:archaellum component FlaC
MSKVLDQQAYFDEHLEHEMVSVEDHIANLKSKIEKREDTSDSRIEELEKLVKKEVEGSLTGRLNQVERQIRDDINRKLNKIEDTLNKLKINVDYTGTTVKKSSGEWKTPFMILVGFLVVACIGLFIFYQHLLKKWKLP